MHSSVPANVGGVVRYDDDYPMIDAQAIASATAASGPLPVSQPHHTHSDGSALSCPASGRRCRSCGRCGR
jgi:hypothetical protein